MILFVTPLRGRLLITSHRLMVGLFIHNPHHNQNIKMTRTMDDFNAPTPIPFPRQDSTVKVTRATMDEYAPPSLPHQRKN